MISAEQPATLSQGLLIAWVWSEPSTSANMQQGNSGV